MSDVLIIAGESVATQRLQAALELEGYRVMTAPTLLAALPQLYLSPEALHVILSAEVGADATEQAELLAAADPGPLGRHSYSACGVELFALAAQ
jgi:hypothetical protein